MGWRVVQIVADPAMLCPLNIKKMAASSRCIASLLKTVHFSPRLCPRLLSRQANYPQYRNIIPRYFSIRPTRFPNYGSNGNWLLRRYCTQQPGQTNQTPADGGPPKPATSILGSVRGIGIADQVLLKKQTDLNDSGQRREQDQTEKKSSSQEERDEEARKKKEADEASWKTIKYSMIFMGVSMSGLAGFLIATWGEFDQWFWCSFPCQRKKVFWSTILSRVQALLKKIMKGMMLTTGSVGSGCHYSTSCERGMQRSPTVK